jgi:hypothetical protein
MLSRKFASTFILAAALVGCGGPTEGTETAPAQTGESQQPLAYLAKEGDILGEEWSGNVQMVYVSCNATNTSYKEVKYVWSWPAGAPAPTATVSDPGCP